MSDGKPERAYCPVCLAKFRMEKGWKEGSVVICPICGQRLKLVKTTDAGGGRESTRARRR